MKAKFPMNKTRSMKKTVRPRAGGQCPECDEARVVTIPTPHQFRYGVGPNAVKIETILPVRHCEACGFEFLDREGEQKQHEAVCKHLGVMTPAQIRDLRINLGLSRAELARLTGLGEATIARWERGSLIQNEANDRYLKLLAHKDNVRRLKQLVSNK
jgi:putative zinc finger/helix-turn-helix YgiT family protein